MFVYGGKYYVGVGKMFFIFIMVYLIGESYLIFCYKILVSCNIFREVYFYFGGCWYRYYLYFIRIEYKIISKVKF